MASQTKPIQILSLGAGVQSSTLALMAEVGQLLPRPDFAVFADTQAEPDHVYQWLGWLEKRISYPLVRVTKGNLMKDSLRIRTHQTTGAKYPERILPVFYQAHGKRQLAQRRCTSTYKIEPIRKFVKQFRKQKVVQWIGISTDEASRMKDSRVQYISHRFPLIERGMSRNDCLQWMRDHNFPEPKKSSCIFCPFHSDSHWLEMKRQDPKAWNATVQFEKDLQVIDTQHDYEPFTPYLHRHLLPLDQVQFSGEIQSNLFLNECEGMCGV